METTVCTIQYKNTINKEPLVIFALAGRAFGKLAYEGQIAVTIFSRYPPPCTVVIAVH